MLEILTATIYGLAPVFVMVFIGLSLDSITKAYRESKRDDKETFRG